KGITGNIYDMGLAVQWSPDNRYLLTLSGDRFMTGSQDYDLFLWDVETGQQAAAREVQNMNDVEHITRAISAGANEYIMKPFDRDIIEAKFHEVGLI
ncbi:MAG: hypothetical protein R6X03_02380, partial [Methyloceanibacter sp.]